jgi:hypothetical protein
VTGSVEGANRRVDRRRFLCASGLTAAALSIPGWAETFGRDLEDEPAKPNSQSTRLREAIERAQRRGLTLLLMRGPEDHPGRLRRLGEMWGAYLTLNAPERGSRTRTKRLADLAMCEIVCAVDTEVVRELPEVEAIPGWVDGIALLVEPRDRCIVLVPGPESIVPWDSTDGEREAGKRRLIGDLGETMRTALAADVDMLRERALANLARLDMDQRKRLANLCKTVPSDVWSAQARHAPACLRLLSETSEALGEQALASLGRAMINRIDNGIDGARWESHWESPPDARVHPCLGASPFGTGAMPPSSLRFLRFFTAREPETNRDRSWRVRHRDG